MKSEKEIREMYDKLKELEPMMANPNLIRLAEWILEIGDKKEQVWWVAIMEGMLDAKRRSKNIK